MARTTWNIDPSHTTISFVARHMVVTKVRGRFRSFRGTLALDREDLTNSAIDVSIDTASIDTADEKRDAHLRSAEFFDADSFPSITYVSKSVAKKGGRYAVTGDLTMHGVTKEVVLDAELEGKGKDPWANQRIRFSAKTSVNREHYGLKWNQVLEAGSLLVSTKIDIELEVQAVLAK
jgi:polyisoprenoid-binding protein YceI